MINDIIHLYRHGEVRDDVATIEVEWIDPKAVPDMEVPETTYELLSDEDFEEIYQN